jgi:hypothetical protein
MPEASPYPTCNHIHEDGALCGSPSLTGKRLCYFHQRDFDRRRNLSQARDVKTTYYSRQVPPEVDAEILESLQFPLLEDAASIQVAISTILRAVAADHIALSRARVMLYAIRLAAANLQEFHAEGAQPANLATMDPAPLPALIPVPTGQGTALEAAPATPAAESVAASAMARRDHCRTADLAGSSPLSAPDLPREDPQAASGERQAESAATENPLTGSLPSVISVSTEI